jgi:hypothetical protein
LRSDRLGPHCTIATIVLPAPPRAPERAHGALCRRVELSRMRESENTQSPRLRFRALLTEGADPRVQLHRA